MMLVVLLVMMVVVNKLEMLYFPERFRGNNVDRETVENMNDDDDMILENDDVNDGQHY
jgi:hypothetical protein